MKEMYNTRKIINESFSTLFPQKTNPIKFKKPESYSEEVTNKLIALECGLDSVQAIIS